MHFWMAIIVVIAIGLALTIYTYTLLSQLIFKPLTLADEAPLIAIEGEFREAHGRRQRADRYHLNQIQTYATLLQGMSL